MKIKNCTNADPKNQNLGLSHPVYKCKSKFSQVVLARIISVTSYTPVKHPAFCLSVGLPVIVGYC